MKRLLIVVAALVSFMALPVDARKLSIYSDAAFTQSSIDDSAPRVVSLYVVDADFWGALGVRFSVEPGPGFTGVWLSEISSHVHVGNTQTDYSVGYGACLPPPVLVVTMSYQLFGTSAACSELRIAPPDGFPCVIVSDWDCGFTEACIDELGHLRVSCPVPTEPTTWGRVKALYRN